MAHDPCPPPPPVASGKDVPDDDLLGFTPKPMVRWFTPSELARAGVESAISSLFGAYADNRELQAVRGGIGPHRYGDLDEVWIDYVADLGDGFDATYAVARLLADEQLVLEGGGATHETRRGRLLVLGGDQVYPTAKRDEYRDRFRGPYRAALSCVTPVEEAPHLFAVPGNHDWYDGLTSFTRLFCQGRWVGGWRTQQARSYFALELPHGWWLWGIDVQLNADIDRPQLEFFRGVGERMPRGSQIILCSAEPTWHSTSHGGVGAYESLAYFEAQTMAPWGHRHAVGLAGDLHAYARWECRDGRQRFISGGGGAYLYPTHRMPREIETPTEAAPRPQCETFTLGTPDNEGGEALFPSRAASRRLALGSLLFPLHNWKFAGFFGLFYLFLAWLVQSASKAVAGPGGETFVEVLARTGLFTERAGVGAAALALWDILAHAPLAFLTALVLFLGLVGFALNASEVGKGLAWGLGAVHTAAHLAAFLVVAWGGAQVNLNVLDLDAVTQSSDALRWLGTGVDNVLQVVLFAVEMAVVGGLAAGLVWGLYLYLSHLLLGAHTNEVFSSQSIPDYKHVLRLRIDKGGDLTIYPIGIRAVPRQWAYRATAAPGKPWFEPVGPSVAERAVLIEPPVRVPGRPVRPAGPARAVPEPTGGDGAAPVPRVER